MPTIFILGNGSEGVLGEKIDALLRNKARVTRDISKRFKKPAFIFYIEKEANKDLEEVVNLAKKSGGKFLYLLPKDKVIPQKILEYEEDISINFVKAPSILFQSRDLIEDKEQLPNYIDSCANKILGIMFGTQTKGGLFFLPEPPFTTGVIKDKKTKEDKPEADKVWLHLSRGKIFLTALLVILAPVLSTILFWSLGLMGLYLFQNNFLAGDISRAQFFTKLAIPSFSIAEKSGNVLTIELAVIGAGEKASYIKSILRMGTDLAEGSYHLTIGTTLLKDHLINLLRNKNTKGEFFTKAKAELFTKAKAELFTKAKAELLFAKEKLSSTQIVNIERLTSYKNMIDKATVFLEVAPQVLGVNDLKTYLVLLQNNMELRPTGGFIGSFGLLSFENGRLLGFDVYDVYDADGQLKGHVDPPLPIKKYLEQPNWFLRDSNWDPDFETSAKQAAWFLDKEIKKKVDGVIAIDVSSAGLIVEAMDNVYLPDYQEKITKDNLFKRAHYYSQKDFFPGSRGKQDFLGALSRAIFEKLQNDEKVSWTRVLNGFLLGVEEKHIMFYFNDPALNKLFHLNNLTGAIIDNRLEKENILNDLFMIVDSNLGVNKVNYFIKKDINYSVDISEIGDVDVLTKIIYINQSQNDSYKNYLRLVSPAGTKIKRVEFDNQELREIDIEEGSGKTIFGFLVNIPPRSQKEVRVTYELKKGMLISKGLNIYNLKILKQPGTLSDSLAVKINYPPFLSIKNIDTKEARVINAPKSLNISSDLRRDREFEVEFLNK